MEHLSVPAPKTFREPAPRAVGDGLSPVAYDWQSRRVPLLALGSFACRWPVGGEGEDTLFCGQATDPCRSYCAHHALRAGGRGTYSERDAARVLKREAV